MNGWIDKYGDIDGLMDGWIVGWVDDPSTIFQVFRDWSSLFNVSCSRTQRSDAGEA